MAKVLNLDGLAKTTRSVTLGGKTYDVKEMTVEDFIEASQEAKRLANVTDAVEQMEATIKLINRAIPDIDVAMLKKLTFDQLAVISKFIQGDMDSDANVSESEGGEKK